MAKRFDALEIEELAAHLCGFAPMDDYDRDVVEEKMMDKYFIDLSYFHDLMNDLFPLLDMAISPLTEEPFIGFGNGKMWLAKKPCENFINSVLQWMDVDTIDQTKNKAYERTITNSGKPEFKLILIKADQEFEIKKGKEVTNG